MGLLVILTPSWESFFKEYTSPTDTGWLCAAIETKRRESTNKKIFLLIWIVCFLLTTANEQVSGLFTEIRANYCRKSRKDRKFDKPKIALSLHGGLYYNNSIQNTLKQKQKANTIRIWGKKLMVLVTHVRAKWLLKHKLQTQQQGIAL